MFRSMPVYMVTGRADMKSARDTVSAWTDGGGNQSLKRFLDNERYTSCDDVTVLSAEFDIFKLAGIDYVVAVLMLDISGSGE